MTLTLLWSLSLQGPPCRGLEISGNTCPRASRHGCYRSKTALHWGQESPERPGQSHFASLSLPLSPALQSGSHNIDLLGSLPVTTERVDEKVLHQLKSVGETSDVTCMVAPKGWPWEARAGPEAAGGGAREGVPVPESVPLAMLLAAISGEMGGWMNGVDQCAAPSLSPACLPPPAACPPSAHQHTAAATAK